MGAALVPPLLEGGRATTLPCERHGSGRERAADYSHHVIGVQCTQILGVGRAVWCAEGGGATEKDSYARGTEATTGTWKHRRSKIYNV